LNSEHKETNTIDVRKKEETTRNNNLGGKLKLD
jgi:hypothetical protein